MHQVNPYAPSGYTKTELIEQDILEEQTIDEKIARLQHDTRDCFFITCTSTFAFERILTLCKDHLSAALLSQLQLPEVGSIRYTTMLLTTAIVIPATCYVVLRQHLKHQQKN